MSETKHTRGPWRASEFLGRHRVTVDAMCINGLVAAVEVADCGKPDPADEMHNFAIQHEANARLIAAAPDLFSELEALEGHARTFAFGVKEGHALAPDILLAHCQRVRLLISKAVQP